MGIFELEKDALYNTMTDFNASPAARLAAGDALDASGWAPDDLDSLISIGSPGDKGFWIAKYPVTNLQYARFLAAPDYADEALWRNLQAFNIKGRIQPALGDKVWQWFRQKGGPACRPVLWNDAHFGATQRLRPVVGVT